jgi:hypothetical protein
MKKALLIAMFFMLALSTFAQVTPIWEKSAAQGTKPSWFDTGNFTRGFGYGNVGGQDYLFVVSRNGGSFIYVLNAATGDSVGKLILGPDVTGGTFTVSDAGVSEDGVIYVCNLALANGNFRVYKANGLTDTLKLAFDYPTGTRRLGDKFTVTGKVSDNTVTIWAVNANTTPTEYVKFTTTDNGATFTPNVVTLGSGLTNSNATIAPYANGFYLNANGINPKKLDLTNTLVGTVPGTVVSTGSNAIAYITTFAGDEYFVTFSYGAGNENGRIVKVNFAVPDSATLYATTPSLGANPNGNGTGDVAVKKNSDGTYTVYVLSTNNGLGAYKVDFKLAGDYFIPVTNLKHGFTTLKEAVTALNTYGTSKKVNFYITANLNEDGIVINRGDLTDSTGLTIKPAANVQPVITISNFPTTGNEKNQAFTIKSTSFVTVDGSNTPNGNTRDMTFVGNQATGSYVIGVIEKSNNVTIKNLNATFTALAASGTILATDGYTVNGQDVSPQNLLVDNCKIGEPTVTTNNGVAIWGNAATMPSSATVSNCEIYASRRGITTYYVKNNKFFNNDIYVVTPRLAQIFYCGIYLTGSPLNDTTVIAYNRIKKVDVNVTGSTATWAAGIAIYGNEGVANIYNNFITPNTVNTNAAPTTTFAVYGIVFNSATWIGKANIYHNSIVVNNSLSTGRHAVIGTATNSAAVFNLYNNIFVNNKIAANSYGIYWTNTPSTTTVLNSNYNDIYVADPTCFVGRYGSTDCATLANWIATSNKDSNSVSKLVNFVDNTDLHLTGTSIGDVDLAAPHVFWIPNDIDLEPRNNAFVYMGADEGSIAVPVELTSFVATTTESGIKLEWQTATETNNRGFEIQRSTDKVNFTTLDFVKGNGTTSERHSYSYIDNSVVNGKVYYRLKQIDYDGTYSYSNVIEADFSMPLAFELSQNYPNPFNPTTVIKFAIPTASKVTVKVFDILGREVAVLANQDFAAGRHSLEFNASGLTSGAYFYTINTEGVDGSRNQAVKKMMLIK